ncbi:MAG TPA: hypothetical protein VIC57_17160 [Candidatus Dormibacteraeota bacterium]|jgi:hypothetical protein
MARDLRRAAAPLLLLLAAAGCARPALPAPATPPPATAAPAPTLAGGWTQALTFSGEVEGAMRGLVPDTAALRSECSGRNSRRAGSWASALFGPVGGGDVYELLVTVRPYRGPGTYRAPDVTVQVARPDGSAVWQTSGGDQASFVVGPGEESGTLSATLTNLASDAAGLRVDGRWSCRT